MDCASTSGSHRHVRIKNGQSFRIEPAFKLPDGRLDRSFAHKVDAFRVCGAPWRRHAAVLREKPAGRRRVRIGQVNAGTGLLEGVDKFP
jgi:hypothetical protein